MLSQPTAPITRLESAATSTSVTNWYQSTNLAPGRRERKNGRAGGGGAGEQTPPRGRKMAAALSQLDDEIVRGMAIGAVFTDYVSSIAKIPKLPAPSMVSAHTNLPRFLLASVAGWEDKLPRFPPQGGSPRHLERGRLHTPLQHHQRDVSSLCPLDFTSVLLLL